MKRMDDTESDGELGRALNGADLILLDEIKQQ
jgi:hypothetical protein